MHTPEFEKNYCELGKRYLEPIGFVYKNSQWSLVNDEHQLSFCLAADKNSPHFKVKYVTLSLKHFGVHRKDMYEQKAYECISQQGAVQISPLYLEGNNARLWHYSNPLKTLLNELVYVPIYYGGKPGIFGSRAPEGAIHKSGVEQLGAKYVSEREALKSLEKYMLSVSRQGLNWANAMTPTEVLRQLKEYNEDWFSEKQWIEAYESTVAPNKGMHPTSGG